MPSQVATDSSESPQQFHYPKLVHKYGLRLLKLDEYQTLDESADHAITGSFINIPDIGDLAKTPSPFSYVAISYCWGCPEKVDKFWISDTEYIGITESVASILRQIRCMDQETCGDYLWIDQLCINQDDTVEKSQQVQMMFPIYYLADHVIAWLGGTEDDGDLAMEAIFDWQYSSAVEELSGRNPVWLPEHMKLGLDRYETLINQSHARSFTHPLYHDSRVQSALARFFDRSWFGRTWIVQEMLAAKRITVMTEGQHRFNFRGTRGTWDRSIDWDSFVQFAKGMEISVPHLIRLPEQQSTSSSSDIMMPRGFASISRIEYLRDIRSRMQQRTSLQRNLTLITKTEASDPRDKIFAAVSFSLECEAPELQPDYSSPVEKVYTSATRYLLLQDQTTDILHSAGVGWSRRISQLPSWVPDYSHTRRTSTSSQPDITLGGIHSSLFAAGDLYLGGLTASIRSDPTDPAVFQIEGMLIDQVEIVSPGLSTGRSLWRSLLSNRQVGRRLVTFWFETTLARICADSSQKAYLGNARSDVKQLLWKHTIYSDLEAFISVLAVGLSANMPWGPSALDSDHMLICKYIRDFLNFMAQVPDQGDKPKSSDSPPYTSDTLQPTYTKFVETEGSGRYQIYELLPERNSLFPLDDISAGDGHWFLDTPFNLISLKRVEKFLRSIDEFSNWCVFRTKSGYIGRGPPLTRPGDQVCVFRGSSTPFLLRKSRLPPLSSNCWQLVGECYVQGLMHKEALLAGARPRKWGPITLV